MFGGQYSTSTMHTSTSTNPNMNSTMNMSTSTSNWNSNPYGQGGTGTQNNTGNQGGTYGNPFGGNSGNTGGGMGGTFGASTPFGESLGQSARSHYQSGYLLSASQANSSPQGALQRTDEVPIIPTKAKMNGSLLRGSTTSDFGMESMFQSSRRTQNLDDEDAPPLYSVNDIPNEVYVTDPGTRFQPRHPANEPPQSRSRRNTVTSPSTSFAGQPPVYIVVFGYPADKYTVTVEYFKSLSSSNAPGSVTEPDHHLEITNCFKVGYREPGDALRAVRKNGEILGGSWMVGVKWADPAQAEAVLGQPILRSSLNSSMAPPETPIQPTTPALYSLSTSMAVDSPMHPSTPSIGTPIRLAPSASAFRPKSALAGTPSKASTPHAVFQSSGGGTPGNMSGIVMTGNAQASPSKGVLGQVSDLIFGW